MKNLSAIDENKDILTKEYVDNKIKTYYGTCTTSASSTSKVVDCTGFVLETGAQISVRFKYTGNKNNYTLNVNNTGAISVAITTNAVSNPTTTLPINAWNANDIVDFVYDGTYWRIKKIIGTTTTIGEVKLTELSNSDSKTLALTPKALDYALKEIITGYDLYSSTSSYAVGDRVRNWDNVYECNTAIPSGGEEFNEDHWDIVPDLQTQIITLANSVGTFTPITEQEIDYIILQ